jgi:hypothetical protein
MALVSVESGVARADDGVEAKTPRALVHHVPPVEAQAGRVLELVAVVEDAWRENTLLARYRRMGDKGAFREVPFERSSAGGYYATIPARDIARPGIEYVIVGIMREGGEVEHFASAAWPHAVRVEPETSTRWIEAEHRRLKDRLSQLHAEVEGNSFGATYGRDYYLRGEIDWTHRVVSWLYSFSLGYGFLEGSTPSELTSAFVTKGVGLRYGFGQVRLRATEVLWLDAGVIIGFSQDDISTGVRGQLVLGKEWRSCVTLGAEHLADLGSSGWLRLQWDTAAPFLMAAEVRATNLPSSTGTTATMIQYEVKYPLTAKATVGANVTFGARGHRPGSLGGGLMAALNF